MLAKTYLHDQIAERLAYRAPDWPAVISRYRETNEYKVWKRTFFQKRDNVGCLAGSLAEIHLRLELEKICADELNVSDRVCFDPIPHGTRTDNFMFYRDTVGKLNCRSSDPERAHLDLAEYDEVLVIDEVPTVFECRIKKMRAAGKNRSPNARGKGYMFRAEQFERLFGPIDDHFKTGNMCLVYVIPPESVSEVSANQQAFREQGGLVIPFYQSRKQYHSEVEGIRQQLIRTDGLEGGTWKPFEKLLDEILKAEK